MSTDFGKVAVLLGGMSAERDVSLKSGRAVFESLLRSGVNAVSIDVDKNIVDVLKNEKIDRVFNVLHGRGGEDGQIQSILNFMGLPYTGSDASSSALAMNKLLSKKIWLSEGLPTPAWVALNNEDDCELALSKLGLPLIVKPILEGSSVGISKVVSKNEMETAWLKAKEYGDVIAEQFIDADEYTCSILFDQTLPIIRLEPATEFYDYEAKYLRDDTLYHCPAGLSEEKENEYKGICLKAFKAIGASGCGRVDFMLNSNGEMFLIELNTVPGMTDHSLVPMAAKQAGIDFDQLVLKILSSAGDVNA